MADPLSDMIQRVLREAPFAMRQLAADAGLSYDVLRSWRSGRRRPSRTSAARLADGLEGRGERLLQLARELKAASAETGGGRDAEAGRPQPPEGAAESGEIRPSGGGDGGGTRSGDSPGSAWPASVPSREPAGPGFGEQGSRGPLHRDAQAAAERRGQEQPRAPEGGRDGRLGGDEAAGQDQGSGLRSGQEHSGNR